MTHRLHPMRFSILWFASLILLSGCENECPPNTEPVVLTTFTPAFSEYKPSFKRVYGLGGKGDIALQTYVDSSFLRLPLSLRADSVVYIFEHTSSKTDTLIFCYNRNIGIYEGRKECGYGVEVTGDTEIFGRRDSARIHILPTLNRRNRTTFVGGEVIYRGTDPDFPRSTFIFNVFTAQIDL